MQRIDCRWGSYACIGVESAIEWPLSATSRYGQFLPNEDRCVCGSSAVTARWSCHLPAPMGQLIDRLLESMKVLDLLSRMSNGESRGPMACLLQSH